MALTPLPIVAASHCCNSTCGTDKLFYRWQRGPLRLGGGAPMLAETVWIFDLGSILSDLGKTFWYWIWCGNKDLREVYRCDVVVVLCDCGGGNAAEVTGC
ncbi:Hypothetical predicted protein [Olea europaea subsp. europaea]|uniref:Uncharacterized protein n=1 Tax=Olea europaea subsp. europaea TaxID=158383 RepID=A0A8S0T7J1_OLEEU|nr:Hypothetical predicted protein [Olea europaea subsp. europaea]